MVNGAVLVQLREDWSVNGQNFTQGSLVQLRYDHLLKDPAHLKPTVVFAPTQKEFLQEAVTTATHLIVTTLENVQGRAYIYTQDTSGNWTHQRLSLPDNIAVNVASTNATDDRFFLNITGFLTPSTLYFGDAARGTMRSGRRASRPASMPPKTPSISTRQPVRTAPKSRTSSYTRRTGSLTAPTRRCSMPMAALKSR